MAKRHAALGRGLAIVLIYCPQWLNDSQMNEVLGSLAMVKKQQNGAEV
jgi:hypothetical protein